MGMEKEAIELQQWLSSITEFKLPSYDELPHVPLYMEQVVGYINGILKPLTPDDKKALTSFMVNNYVKAKMIPEPDRKKYSEEQLGYLIAVSALKNTMSMSEISMLMEMDKSVSDDKKEIYDFYRSMSQDILSERSSEIKSKVDSLLSSYQDEKKGDEAKASLDLHDSLATLALRTSIESVAYKIIVDMILDVMARAIHGEATYEFENTPGHHESQRELKIAKAQAERLAAAKEAAAKKSAEEAKKEAEQKRRQEAKDKVEAARKARAAANNKAKADAKKKADERKGKKGK